jgi:hypothetical protein
MQPIRSCPKGAMSNLIAPNAAKKDAIKPEEHKEFQNSNFGTRLCERLYTSGTRMQRDRGHKWARKPLNFSVGQEQGRARLKMPHPIWGLLVPQRFRRQNSRG